MATKIIDKLVVDGKGSAVVCDGLDFTKMCEKPTPLGVGWIA